MLSLSAKFPPTLPALVLNPSEWRCWDGEMGWETGWRGEFCQRKDILQELGLS